MAASTHTGLETGNDADIILKQEEPESVPPPEKKMKTDISSNVDHPDMKMPSDDEEEEEEEEIDSEDEECNDGYHNMTKKEADRYFRQLSESQGFDMDGLPYVFGFGIIQPANVNVRPDVFEYFTKLAIDEYNKNSENTATINKLVKVVKANIQGACPVNYYITFEAEDSDGQIKTYQAKVDHRIPKEESEVDLVRLKPGSN